MEHSGNQLIPSLELESVTEFIQLIESIEQDMLRQEDSFWKNAPHPFNECTAYQKIKALPADKKVLALRALIYRANTVDSNGKQLKPVFESKDLLRLLQTNEELSDERIEKLMRDNNRQTLRSNLQNIDTSLLWRLFTTKLDFPKGFGFNALFLEMFDTPDSKNISLEDRPFVGFVTQIEKHVKQHGAYNVIVSEIQSILSDTRVNTYLTGTRYRHHREPEIERAVTKLAFLVSNTESKSVAVLYPFGDEPVGRILHDTVESASSESRVGWHTMLHHLATASGSKPSKKFLRSSSELVDRIGVTTYRESVLEMFEAIIQIDEEEPIEESQKDLVKGMLWSMCQFNDDESLRSVTNLTLRCFRHVSYFGPAAASVGNAGIYVLGRSDGLVGLNYLSFLKTRIRRNSTCTLIQKYLDQKAEEFGLTSAQIEEMAVSDFDLHNGVRIEHFGEYQLKICLLGAGRVEQQWINPQGKVQKSAPSFIKKDYDATARLKLIREQLKQIKQLSSAQRVRIEQIYLENRTWDMESFDKHYLNHGLVCRVATCLIWQVDDQPCLFYDGQWQNHRGEPVTVSKTSSVAMWHPLQSDTDTVLAWRDRLQELEIQQPFKQAHREIYIVTEEEKRTQHFSSRMAAHFIKQYAMNALAVTRGWQYSLIGPFDGGNYAEVIRAIPAHDLNARLIIKDVADDSQSDGGMWLYVSTHQMDFSRSGEPVDLALVPPIVFSEIMRDLDLFVGVSSVTNDPYWEDKNYSEPYIQYWRDYSFADLGEEAKTRKHVLQQLLPKLKIRDVASIEGKYLVVNGKKHSYKIHIGSGNVLMQPDDQYLSIVSAPSKKQTLKIFLPFEGDTMVSVVLSKAFLLAEDDKIEDPTILSQFGRQPGRTI